MNSSKPCQGRIGAIVVVSLPAEVLQACLLFSYSTVLSPARTLRQSCRALIRPMTCQAILDHPQRNLKSRSPLPRSAALERRTACLKDRLHDISLSRSCCREVLQSRHATQNHTAQAKSRNLELDTLHFALVLQNICFCSCGSRRRRLPYTTVPSA